MTKTLNERQPTLLERMGGVSGLLYAAVPSVAYAAVNGIAGLDAAIVVAVGASMGIILLRVLRKQSIQSAVSGLVGVLVAVAIAYYTGSAEAYFLPGIWMSLVAAVVFTISVLVRRPLVGLVWNLLTGAENGHVWHTDRIALRGFDLATLVFAAVCASRFVVQGWLYGSAETGWLSFARIAMGYPLLGLALLVSYWAIRRARRRLEDYNASVNSSAASMSHSARYPANDDRTRSR